MGSEMCIRDSLFSSLSNCIVMPLAETLSKSTANHVYVYAKQEGLFAGASANGMTMQFDNEENKAVYGAATSDLISGTVDTPKGLEGLAQALKAAIKPAASN